MSKRNTDFFKVKKDWSRVKDTLLRSYLPVYFSKVIHTGKPIVYIDCFAGKGKFDNGEDGSPRIALRERKLALERSRYGSAKIDMYFIDPAYANELQTNISDFGSSDEYGSIRVLKSTYEQAVPEILAGIGDANVFLYVDPFGIKYLGNRIFANACRNFKGTVEVLLNLNSFGFIREACRITGTVYRGENIELEEQEEEDISKSDGAERTMTAIAGGDYWKRIIEAYRANDDPTVQASLQAEKTFSSEYRRRLSKAGGGPFRYVLDIPIRIKTGAFPKYRMVHATNHPDGCIEMADNMMRRADELYTEIQSCGQMSLFQVDTNQNFTAPLSLLIPQVMDVIRQQTDAFRDRVQALSHNSQAISPKSPVPLHLHPIIADFFCENGVVCTKSNVIEALKQLEREGKIEVSRNPPTTEHGAASKFWSESKGKSVYIREKEAIP